MQLWRIHIRPGGGQGNMSFSFETCINQSVLGVGWQVKLKNSARLKPEEYRRLAEEEYPDMTWVTPIKFLQTQIKIDDLVWTRDTKNQYYLARVTGGWEYRDASENQRADIANVIPVIIYRVGIENSVPGKVIASFRGRRTLQRILDNTTRSYSQILYNKLSYNEHYEVEVSDHNIFNLLSAEDIEDVIFIYMQHERKYIVCPNSRHADTMSYEYILKKPGTGEEAVVQVKTGGIPLNRNDYKEISDKVYLFSSSGEYHGAQYSNIETIDPGEIRRFMFKYNYMMPRRIKTWLDEIDKP